MNFPNIDTIPYFGVGLGLRREIANKILEYRSEIDVLEFTPENYMDTSRESAGYLEKFAKVFPLVPHGLRLSVGTASGLDEPYLKKLKTVLDTIGAAYHSDHFALSDAGGMTIGHLSPLWFTKEGLDVVVKNIRAAQKFLELPLVLEGITSFFEIPGGDFDEAEFIARACEATGCGLLLDVTNVYINAYNKKTDPYEFLKKIPLERVVHVHLAGGRVKHGWFYDTHSEELGGINEGVWPIFKWVAKRAQNIKTVIIERDQNFKEDFEEMILKDVRRARAMLQKSKSPKPSFAPNK